ncbi:MULTISPECIES: M16 family metallopeptidase [Sphingobacterium]|uniref:M16 family metallopeptidase n=1 Tax=Sphingobacterium TaxID=28453 RepID=UPI0013DC2FCF|nr:MULTISPECIES: insulinase family protein [unclassified Sphingobacterium]
MRNLLLVILVAICGTSTGYAQGDFAARKDATQGKLANGIQYYTLSTPWIKGKMAIGMIVKTGSLYETQDEVGIAHFLEHLVSTSVPGFDRRKSLDLVYDGGLNLFQDWQAFTSEVRTIYNYTYSKENKDTEDKLIQYIRGVLGHMQFTQREVDIERPAILAETKTSYSSGGLSNLRGGYFEKHTILGDSAQIAAITPQKVENFYRKWYRPENIALVLIGDAGAMELEQKLKSAFSDAKCVVDSALPQAFLPVHEDNVALFSPSEVEVDKRKGFMGRLIYRFPLIDLTQRKELRKAIAVELITDIFKGMLEGYKTGMEVTAAIPSNMPTASVLNVKFNFQDTSAFQNRLKEIGGAISHLRYGDVDVDFLQSLWKSRSSVYKYKVKLSDSHSPSVILNSIYSNFTANLPIADPTVFAQALDEAAAQLTPEDIRAAAEIVFTNSRAFLAGLPDYGKGFEVRMVNLLDESSNQPDVRIAYQLPTARHRMGSKSSGEVKALLQSDRPRYKKSMLQHQTLLPNGMQLYRLKNGMEIIWNKSDRRNSISLETDAGTVLLKKEEQPFASQFKEIRDPVFANKSLSELDALKRAWGSPSLTLKYQGYKSGVETTFTADNFEFVIQYLANLYKGFAIDEKTFSKELEKFNKSKEGAKGANSVVMDKNELEIKLNSLLIPGQTRLFIQGDIDIEQVIAYLSEIPVKDKLRFVGVTADDQAEDTIELAEAPKGRTYLVNRMTKDNVQAITLKRYILQGMVEEYMSRNMLLHLRNEKGLIYAWGTTPSFGVHPSPHVSLSLRFRVIPELLDTALVEFNMLCEKVAREGIDQSSLKGLKRREWNRYVDYYNDPDQVMLFVSNQLKWTGKVWKEKEFKNIIESITLNEVNAYIKRYMALPSHIKTY